MADPQSNRPNTNNRFRPDSTAFFRAANFELFVKPVNFYILDVLDFNLKNVFLYFFLQSNENNKNETIRNETKNKYVMSIGVISFSLCIFYFYQWNRQVRQQSITTSTYVAINEDNTETIRSRKSRWD